MERIQNLIIESIEANKNCSSFPTYIASHPHPCGICTENVNYNQKAILCRNCGLWIHIKCNGTTLGEYNALNEHNETLDPTEIDDDAWYYSKCQIIFNTSTFPFALEDNYDLINI